MAHRDLKPSNIMITHNGKQVKVIDFGLADTDTHAVFKQPAGTRHYMAPEQASSTVPDVRNDIYSLGVIILKMDVDGIYDRACKRCLRPIDERYQTVADLPNDLQRMSTILKWVKKGAITFLLCDGIISAIVVYTLWDDKMFDIAVDATVQGDPWRIPVAVKELPLYKLC